MLLAEIFLKIHSHLKSLFSYLSQIIFQMRSLWRRNKEIVKMKYICLILFYLILAAFDFYPVILFMRLNNSALD